MRILGLFVVAILFVASSFGYFKPPKAVKHEIYMKNTDGHIVKRSITRYMH